MISAKIENGNDLEFEGKIFIYETDNDGGRLKYESEIFSFKQSGLRKYNRTKIFSKSLDSKKKYIAYIIVRTRRADNGQHIYQAKSIKFKGKNDLVEKSFSFNSKNMTINRSLDIMF